MTNEEAERAVEALRDVVGGSSLAWVLVNVDEEIRQGKPGTRSLEKTGDRKAVHVEGSLPPGARGKYEAFTTVTPFEAVEKLHILTTAIDRVLREIPQLQEATLRQLSDFGAQGVTFADDTSDREYQLESMVDLERVSVQLSRLLVTLEG